MGKRPLKLTVRIPNFEPDWKQWRRGMNEAIVKAQADGAVAYGKNDKLEVRVQFHLRNPKLTILDLDNRLKDVFDALQGCIGDKGKRGILAKIIPNDSQIYRVIAEKRLAPKAYRKADSTIVIRRYDQHRSTARSARDTRKHQPPNLRARLQVDRSRR